MPRYTRVLSTLALLCSALPATADAFVPQTPITVQVINDSGRPDSEVMLLLVGQDVAGKNSDGSTTTYPFSVSSVTSVDMRRFFGAAQHPFLLRAARWGVAPRRN